MGAKDFSSPANNEQTTPLTKWSVVLIEDNEADQFLITRLLRKMGDVKTTIFNTGKEAEDNIDIIKQSDCVLLDHSLPDKNGLECLKGLEQQVGVPPVIMLSGCSDERVMIESLKTGAKDYLLKDNLTQGALERSISNAITKHQLATKLENRNEEARQFALVLSHDLKSPLRVMSLISEQITDSFDREPFDFENTKLQFQELNQSLSYVRRLVNGLVTFLQQGRGKHLFAATDLNEIVARVISALSYDHLDYPPEITVSNLPTIHGDRVGLTQIFQNLIDNGVKYNTKDKRTVKIWSEFFNDRHKIFVQDNGIGIESEHFLTIFQPLRRLHRNDEFEGTGLGLALVKKIVTQHDGTITLDSVPGEHTTFILDFPLVDNTNTLQDQG